MSGHQILRQLLMPATVFMIDEAVGNRAPDAAVTILVEGVGRQVFVEEVGRTRRLAHGPPEFRPLVGSIIPVERIKEAALVPVPAKRHGLHEQGFGGDRHPVVPAFAQHPELENKAGPFQPMAGCGAGGAEHFVAAIILVEGPVFVEMLRHAEIQFAGAAADDEIGDAFGLVEVIIVAGHLIGRHQRFGQMHVGVLATVIVDGRPVAVEFLGDSAVLLLPETGFQHIGDIGQHPVGERVADGFGGRGGQKHEGVAITLLGGVHWAGIVHLPEITAMVAVAMSVPEIGHAVVDDIAAARTAKQVADGEAVDHAGGGVDAAHRVVRLQRRALGVQIKKAAGRIEGPVLEEVEKPLGLFYQPLAVPGQCIPVAAVVVVLGHVFLHAICCFGLYPCHRGLSSGSDIS
ncbi:hypothetical protein AT6N2_C3511 [Agrobacterium tumefaciens]|nr:hypothetical protein AT6N2_C3511 [Agrobacterium tumefaciens]